MSATIDMIAELTPMERRLLDEFQHDFPLVPHPYAEIAGRLGVNQQTVLDAYERLKDAGLIARIGAVIGPHMVGWSTLAAMAVPDDRLEAVADLVSGYAEVNHNYEREHPFNLWFVLTVAGEARGRAVLDEIEALTGLDVMELPLVETYHLDLGFPIQWD